MNKSLAVKGTRQSFAEKIIELERAIENAGSHSYLVNLKEYRSNGLSFKAPVAGSTSNPNDSRTTTPSKTLSIKSETQTANGPSFPFNFIQALPLFTFSGPTPVITFFSSSGFIPISSATDSGKVVNVAPVSTNAFTFLDFFLFKSDISISTHECPISLINNNRKRDCLNSYRFRLKACKPLLPEGVGFPALVECENLRKGEYCEYFVLRRFSNQYFDKLDLNERQRKALKVIFEKGKISNADYTEMFKVSRNTATNDLSDLVEKGLVKRIGTGRGSYYAPKI